MRNLKALAELVLRGGSRGYRAYLLIRSDFSDIVYGYVIVYIYNVWHLCYIVLNIRNSLHQYDIKLSFFATNNNMYIGNSFHNYIYRLKIADYVHGNR